MRLYNIVKPDGTRPRGRMHPSMNDRIAWTGIGARDAGDARLFAGLVREACDVADRINHSREGRQAARLGDDYLESLGIER